MSDLTGAWEVGAAALYDDFAVAEHLLGRRAGESQGEVEDPNRFESSEGVSAYIHLRKLNV